MDVIGQSGSNRKKLVVFMQSGCIREKVVVVLQCVFIWAR